MTETTNTKDSIRTTAALTIVGDDLYAVQEARLALDHAEAGLRASVAAAKDVGATWSELGEVMDVTRQAAQQRFGS